MSIRDKPLYVRYHLARYVASKIWSVSYWMQDKANKLDAKANRLERKYKVNYKI